MARGRPFRAAYEQAAGAIAQIDQVIRTLDELRVEMGIAKASSPGGSTGMLRASGDCSPLSKLGPSFS
jgi:hypothetical protein